MEAHAGPENPVSHRQTPATQVPRPLQGSLSVPSGQTEPEGEPTLDSCSYHLCRTHYVYSTSFQVVRIVVHILSPVGQRKRSVHRCLKHKEIQDGEVNLWRHTMVLRILCHTDRPRQHRCLVHCKARCPFRVDKQNLKNFQVVNQLLRANPRNKCELQCYSEDNFIGLVHSKMQIQMFC